MTSLDPILRKAQLYRSLPSPAECKELRKRHKLTDQEVADALGVSRNTIQRWERGDRFPGPSNYLPYVAFIEALMAIERR